MSRRSLIWLSAMAALAVIVAAQVVSSAGHTQQLVALVLGADPVTVCGVKAHSQDVEPILERIGARTKVSV